MSFDSGGFYEIHKRIIFRSASLKNRKKDFIMKIFFIAFIAVLVYLLAGCESSTAPVTKKTISEFSVIQPQQIKFGSDPSFPESVQVTFSDGTQGKVITKWTGKFDPITAGTYAFKASIDSSDFMFETKINFPNFSLSVSQSDSSFLTDSISQSDFKQSYRVASTGNSDIASPSGFCFEVDSSKISLKKINTTQFSYFIISNFTEMQMAKERLGNLINTDEFNFQFSGIESVDLILSFEYRVAVHTLLNKPNLSQWGRVVKADSSSMHGSNSCGEFYLKSFLEGNKKIIYVRLTPQKSLDRSRLIENLQSVLRHPEKGDSISVPFFVDGIEEHNSFLPIDSSAGLTGWIYKPLKEFIDKSLADTLMTKQATHFPIRQNFEKF